MRMMIDPHRKVSTRRVNEWLSDGVETFTKSESDIHQDDTAKLAGARQRTGPRNKANIRPPVIHRSDLKRNF